LVPARPGPPNATPQVLPVGLPGRLARDFERYCSIAAAFVRMAMIRIMLPRLAAKLQQIEVSAK
jgi:hypothetical protein